MLIRWNDDEWPLVRVVFVGEFTTSDADAYHDALLARMERARLEGTRFAIVGDVSDTEPPGFEARNKLAAFSSANRVIMRRTVAGIFLYMTKPMQRAALAVVSWLFPPPVPLLPFATLAQAETAARKALDERIVRDAEA